MFDLVGTTETFEWKARLHGCFPEAGKQSHLIQTEYKQVSVTSF